MVSDSQRQLGVDICTILGLDPNQVVRLEIVVAADDRPLVHIERMLGDDEATEFRELLLRCEVGPVVPHLTVPVHIGGVLTQDQLTSGKPGDGWELTKDGWKPISK